MSKPALLQTIDNLDAEIKRLREALRECEGELNGYYQVEYGGDHPYSRKKLANAMQYNPATLALAKLKGEE